MRYRRFGRTGWNVSEIGYGMWGMAGWTGSDDKESLGSLQSAIDLGCNFFDTAWAYGNGHSEELLGKILRANKNSASAGGPDKKLYVATKVPPQNRSWPARPEFSLDESYPPDYIFEYVDKSLKNIGVSTLDLIQLHTWEDTWLGDERILPAIEKLRRSGKVRAVGLSLNRWEPANGIRAVRTGLILNNLDVHTTIPGMRKPKHVASNLAASDQGPLPAQLHAQLRPHRWVRTPTKWSQ